MLFCCRSTSSGTTATWPKVELHVHLDGSFDQALLWEAVDVGSLPEAVPMAWDATQLLRVQSLVRQCRTQADYHNIVTCKGKQSLQEMLKCFEIFLPTVRGRLDLIERMAEAFCARQARSRVVYTEVRYSPHLLTEGGQMNGMNGSEELDPVPVVDAVTKGLRAGCAKYNVVVNQIMCAITFRPNWAGSVVDIAAARKNDFPCAVVGVDIAAGESFLDELGDPASYTAHRAAFERASQLGIGITVHAGEEGNAKHVITAIREFGAQRVGHGYAVAESPEALDMCIRAGVHFECCPTSAFDTGGWEGPPPGTSPSDWSGHPICKLVRSGASVGLNSDDPAVFDTSMDDEYHIAQMRMRLTQAELRECTLAAIDAAFTTSEQKEGIRKQLTRGRVRGRVGPLRDR